MAKIKAEKPVKVKATKEVVKRPKISEETRESMKKLFEQSAPSEVKVNYTPLKNIDKYLSENGVNPVYDGQKLSLTVEQIKALILNW
jgi:hypothetical protein